MPSTLAKLKDTEWDDLKKAAGITSTSFLRALFKGTASVGSAIKEFESARGYWKGRAKTMTDADIDKYEAALKKLDAAFKKFAAEKDFKSNDAKILRTAIEGWQDEIVKKLKKVADGRVIYAKEIAIATEKYKLAAMEKAFPMDL